jgi:hypothetical protein
LIGHGFGPSQWEEENILSSQHSSQSLSDEISKRQYIYKLLRREIAEADASFTLKHHAGCILSISYNIFSAGGNPAAIEFCPNRELCARISSHVLTWPNLMRGGIKGLEDVYRTLSSCGISRDRSSATREGPSLPCKPTVGIQCHIIRAAEANGATSGYMVSFKNMTYQRSSQGTETRQKQSAHWVLSIHERKLNKLKMQRGLAVQKDYWNCYCELR